MNNLNYKELINNLKSEIKDYFNIIKENNSIKKGIKKILCKYEGLINLKLIEEVLSNSNLEINILEKEINKALNKEIKRREFESELNQIINHKNNIEVSYKLYRVMRHLENSNSSFFDIINNVPNKNIIFCNEDRILNYVYIKILEINNHLIETDLRESDFYKENKEKIYYIIENELKRLFDEDSFESYYDIDIIGKIIVKNINKLIIVNKDIKEKYIDINKFDNFTDLKIYLDEIIL